jgi:phosphoglycolate phosphatase
MPVINVLKNKYKLGVITNTDTDIAIKILKKFRILEYFDVVVGGDIINPKPSPDPIIKACNFFMIKPEETLFIGDTLTDIKAGKAAGSKTVIITTSKKRDEIEGIKDIIVFNDLIEILKIV